MQEIETSRNRVIITFIGLIILGIIYSIAEKLPGADNYITGFLFVAHLIQLGLAVIMILMAVTARKHIAFTVEYYAQGYFKPKYGKDYEKAATNVVGLSKELANIILIAIAWPLTVRVVDILLYIDPTLDLGWISIIVTLGFVFLLLYRLYIGYTLIGPVLSMTSKPKQLVCSKCGSLNRLNAQFCVSCGEKLQPVDTKETPPKMIKCPSCGAENAVNSKYCESCGTSLA